MKSKNIADSFRNAYQGIRQTVAGERNFKIHLVMGIVAIICCIIFQVETVLFIWVLFAIFSVLVLELINTAIEALTDLICGKNRHPLAKKAKDAAAAAVLIASLQAVAVACVVAWSVLKNR